MLWFSLKENIGSYVYWADKLIPWYTRLFLFQMRWNKSVDHKCINELLSYQNTYKQVLYLLLYFMYMYRHTSIFCTGRKSLRWISCCTRLSLTKWCWVTASCSFRESWGRWKQLETPQMGRWSGSKWSWMTSHPGKERWQVSRTVVNVKRNTCSMVIQWLYLSLCMVL